jgi:hypothetical protein
MTPAIGNRANMTIAAAALCVLPAAAEPMRQGVRGTARSAVRCVQADPRIAAHPARPDGAPAP